MHKEIAVYDNTVSARTYLSYIAEQAGGFACIGRDGKLYIRTFECATGTKIVEGSEIVVNSEKDTYIKLAIDGHSEQETRDGKNKFNLDNIPNGSSYVIKTQTGAKLKNCWVSDIFGVNGSEKVLDTFKPNTTYTMRAKAKVISRPSTIISHKVGTFILYRAGSSGNSTVAIPVLKTSDDETIALNTEKEYITTFTTPSDMTDVRFLAYSFYGNNDGSTTGTSQGEIDISEIMLVEGSYTAENFPDFELYGASPSPEYPSEIKSVGESWNIFNINTAQLNKALTWTQGTYFTENGSVSSDFIEVKKGETYTSKYYMQVILFDENKTYIKQYNSTNAAVKTFTINQENMAKYVKVCFYTMTNNNIDFTQIKDMQLVEGKEEKPYRPYGYNLFIEKKSKNEFDDNKAYDLIKLAYSNGVYSASDNDTRSFLQYKIQQYNNSTFLGADSQVTKVIASPGKYYFTSTKVENANNIRIANAGTTYEFNLRYPLDNIAVGEKFTVVIDVIDATIGASKFKDVMLLKGEITEADYEPYFYDTYTIPLEKPLRSLPNGVKDTLEKDGIHRRVGSVTLDGTAIIGTIGTNNYGYTWMVFNRNLAKDAAKGAYRKPYCNIANGTTNFSYRNYSSSLIVQWPDISASFCMALPTEIVGSSIETVQQYFQEQYDNGTPVKIQYELAEEVVEEYTEEQLAVINSLNDIKINKGSTYFSCPDNVKPIFTAFNVAEIPFRYFQDFKWGEKFTITRIKYEDGIQLFEQGDTAGNTVYISQDNMYIVSQDQIDNIYIRLKGLEIYSFEGNSIIDPAIDAGDIILIDGRKVIYQGSSQYCGKWKASISSKIQCKSKEETMSRVPSQKTIIRRVQSQINQAEGIISSLIEVTDGLDSNIDLLSADMQNKLGELGQALAEYQATVSTQFQQTNKDFTFLFNTLVEQINNSTGDSNEKLLEINKYIRFEEGNIILGRSDNELVLKIQNDRISYTQNGSEVAYFSNNKLYVNELEVITKFYLGNFAFIPRTNGNLSFKKVRG